MGVLYTNNASTTLAAGLNDSATSTTVASSSGFPTISGSNYFYATLELADGSAHEIVKVTAVSGTTWTIVRGQDNTSARAFSSSDKVELRINSALLTDVVNDALASTFTRQAFTGDGSDTTFTLSRTPNSENDLFVFIEGVFQPHSTYSLSGTTLTFSEAPANSREITVYHVSAAVSGDSLSLNTFSGNGSTTAFTMSVDPVHENNTMVFIEGVYQEKSTYATSGTTLTFDAAPANGTSIDVTTHTQSLINVPVDASVTLAKMAANSVDSDQYVDGSIDTAHIADSQITVAKMAANSVDSDQYVDGSIDTAHYADNSITGAELADNIAIAGTLDVAGAVVFNEGSADVDFRVESNGNANMLFVDGGNDKVGIGVGAPTARLSLPAQASGDSGIARFAIESAVDSNDFTISQYEDGTGTYTLMGQNISLNSGGNVTVLDSAHKTAGVLFDGRGNGQLQFYTGAANASSSKMTVDSVGNVGIGASPVASASAYNSAALHLHQASGGSTGSQIHLTNAATGGAAGDGSFIAQWSDQHLYITNQESKDIAFSTGGAERMRLTSDGVGIGTTPAHPLHIVESADGAKIRLTRGGVCEWDFSIGNTSTLSGVGSGALELLPQNANTANEFAIGTAGSTAALFHLTNSYNYFQKEVSIGRTTSAGTTDHGIDLYDSGHLYLFCTATGANNVLRVYDGNGALKASIDADGDYNDHSDENYKENITDASSVLSTIADIKVRSFNWKEDGRKQSYGFIAQELKDVAPEATKIPQEDGDMWGVKNSKIVPMLVKAIQELSAKNDALEARLKTLEDA